MRDVLHLSQKMGNNFEVVQCTLLNKLVSLNLLYFENVGQVVITEWLLFLGYIGKAEGEAAGRHCNTSGFISMPLCLFVFLSLFLAFSLCLFVCFVFVVFCFVFLILCFFFCLHLKENHFDMNGISYYITCLWLHLFVHVDLLCDHFCAGRESFKNERPLE